MVPLLLAPAAEPQPAKDPGPAPGAEEPGPAHPEVEKGANDAAQLVLNTGGHTAPIRAAHFGPDGQRLVTVGDDRTVQVWDLRSGDRVRVLWLPAGNGERGRPTDAAFDPSGRFLAYAAGNADEKGEPVRLVYLLDLETRKLEILARLDAFPALAFSPDGKLLAVTDHGGVQLWDYHKRQRVGQLPYKAGNLVALAFAPDSQRLAVGLAKGKVDVWRLTRKKEVGGTVDFEVADKPGRKIAWADDNTLLTAWNLTLRAWSAAGANKGHEIKSHALAKLDPRIDLAKWPGAVPVWLEVLPRGREVLVGWSHGTGNANFHHVGALAVDWNKGTGRPVGPLLLSTNHIPFRTAASADGKRAVLHGGNDYGAYVFDLAKGQVVQRLIGSARPADRFRFGWSPDGQAILWGTEKQTEDFHKVRPADRLLSLNQLRLVPADKSTELARSTLTELGGLTVSRTDATTLALTGRKGLDKVTTIASKGATFSLLAGDCLTVQGTHYYDTRTGAQLGVLPFAGIYEGFKVSPDGRYVLARTLRETLQLIRPRPPDGKWVLLSVFVSGDDWVAWTPEGYYAATPGGEKLMGWVVTRGLDRLATFHPASQFRKLLYRPEVVKLVAEKGNVAVALKDAGPAVTGPKTRSVTLADALPPQATLEVIDQTALPRVKIKARATAAAKDQPVVALRLLVDGRPLPGKEGVADFGAGKAAVDEEWTVTLPEGKHTLTVLARGPEVSGVSEPVEVANVNPTQLPLLRVLAVGVSKYQDPALNLDFADADAKALAGAFVASTKKGDLFRDVEPITLLNDKATQPGVLAALKELRKAKPNDLAVVFFAGHGVKQKEAYYLLTTEAKLGALDKTALSGDDLRKELQGMPCQVLLMLDACHSAGFGQGKPLAKEGLRPATDDAARELADDEVGVAVLCAAMGHEKAEEKSGNGLFTRAVIDALSQAEGVQYNRYTGLLYVHHLHSYVFDEVVQRSGDRQHPFLNLPWVVESFPLAKFKTKAAAAP
jgi:WD40 repeat protein